MPGSPPSTTPEDDTPPSGKGPGTLLAVVAGVACVALLIAFGPWPASPGTSEPDGARHPDGAASSPAARTVADYPGRPPAGTIWWGASVTGNGDPTARHEQPAGRALGVRRTFFQWDEAEQLVATARTDVEAGRLPWVSTKTPSWTEVAAGEHDAALDTLLRELDHLPGPVWLTVHHEPEGGGGVDGPDDPAGPSGHVAMNQRVRDRMTELGTDSIALLPVLMSYTFMDASGRDPDAWWAPGIYDLVGIDHYRDDPTQLLDATWHQIRRWAAERGMDVAVGEWGVRGNGGRAAEAMESWYDHAVASGTDGQGARVVALTAFDSSLNSPDGSWELQGEQLEAFHELLQRPTSAWRGAATAEPRP